MKRFFTWKRAIIGVIVLILLGGILYNVFGSKSNADNIISEPVKQIDLKQTVLATGQVTSTTDLGLTFKSSGIVAKVNTKVGAQVTAGQALANLEQKDQQASVTQARGSLAQARANLSKVLAGASTEEVQVAQKAVEAAEVTLANAKRSLEIVKTQQDTLVKNAYSAFLNSSPEALPNPTNISSPTVTVSGTYIGSKEGTYVLRAYQTANGPRLNVTGLESADVIISLGVAVPLGKNGLYVTFSGNPYADDSWSITLPNTRASTYVANQNIYNSALETRKSALESAQSTVNSAQVSLEQAQANLNLKQAQARPADVQVAQAQVLSAQGQLQAAEAALENTIIRAPADGTITIVDIKVGELAQPTKSVITLQDVTNLHVEANISEANIANLAIGQSVEMTFDALGPDQKFMGKVQAIDPASTVVSGVVNYKITAAVEKLDLIKPGMTANLTILVNEKDNVLVIPQRAVIEKSGKKYTRIITDPKTKDFKEVEISTGLEGDGGLIEIISGVKSGDEVVTLIKS